MHRNKYLQKRRYYVGRIRSVAIFDSPANVFAAAGLGIVWFPPFPSHMHDVAWGKDLCEGGQEKKVVLMVIDKGNIQSWRLVPPRRVLPLHKRHHHHQLGNFRPKLLQRQDFCSI